VNVPSIAIAVTWPWTALGIRPSRCSRAG
jgi:hypothetical protein